MVLTARRANVLSVRRVAGAVFLDLHSGYAWDVEAKDTFWRLAWKRFVAPFEPGRIEA